MRERSRRAPNEAGFSLVELLVVLVMLAILMAIALPNVRSASRGPDAPAVAIAGGRIWRAVEVFRLENGGTMPTTTQMAGEAPGLVDPAGKPSVRPWPETQKGVRLVISTGAGATPPVTGTPNSMSYASAGTTGWLAGYGPLGKLVFSRIVSPAAIPAEPKG